MQEVAAYLLLVLGGKASPSGDDVKSVLTAAGNEEPSDDTIATLVGDLEGKTIDELLAAGMEKIKDISIGGSGGGGGGSGGAGGDVVAEVEEEKPEEEEVGDAPVVDMFGAGDGGDY